MCGNGDYSCAFNKQAPALFHSCKKIPGLICLWFGNLWAKPKPLVAWGEIGKSDLLPVCGGMWKCQVSERTMRASFFLPKIEKKGEQEIDWLWVILNLPIFLVAYHSETQTPGVCSTDLHEFLVTQRVVLERTPVRGQQQSHRSNNGFPHRPLSPRTSVSWGPSVVSGAHLAWGFCPVTAAQSGLCGTVPADACYPSILLVCTTLYPQRPGLDDLAALFVTTSCLSLVFVT